MKSLIRQQLDKVSVADLSNFDEKNNTYIIPKFKQLKVGEGDCYIIRLDASLLNPNENTLLVSNWNKGTTPIHSHYKVEITKVMGKMIKVNGLGYDYVTGTDLNDVWTGWLPLQQVEFLTKL